MTSQAKVTLRNALVVLLVLSAVTACTTALPAVTPFPTVTPEPTATPQPSPTPEPTPTATPEPTTTVCATGCDFSTIQAALDDAGTAPGAIIGITDSVHTEAGIIVSKSVTIQGLGAGSTLVQGHATRESAIDRVFLIASGATVTIRGITIRHGHPTDEAKEGGGITNQGTLTLESCIVSDNNASAGGGIHNEGTMTLINSTVSGNIADGTGGILTGCGTGGGIKNLMGTLTLTNSTVSGNNSQGNGGGIFVACKSTLELVNSTVSGNDATGGSGGGVYIRGAAEFTNSTISSNHAANTGGGVYIKGSGEDGLVRGWLDFTNTIISNNTDGRDYCCDDCMLGDYGTIGINTNNLVGDGSCDPAYSGDAQLGPLADNGGETQTHSLLTGSPAIDAVSATSCTLTTDQRGRARPISQVSTETPCDMGAFELQPGEE